MPDETPETISLSTCTKCQHYHGSWEACPAPAAPLDLDALPTFEQFRKQLVAFANATHMLATDDGGSIAYTLNQQKDAARDALRDMFNALLAASRRGGEDTARQHEATCRRYPANLPPCNCTRAHPEDPTDAGDETKEGPNGNL